MVFVELLNSLKGKLQLKNRLSVTIAVVIYAHAMGNKMYHEEK